MRNYIILIAAVFLVACNGNKDKIDVSNIDLNIQVIRFDNDLFTVNSEDTASVKKSLHELRQKYPSFFERFNKDIIEIGNSHSEMYPVYLQMFLTNEAVKSAWKGVQTTFANDNELNDKLTDAFKHFKYYFPNKLIPKVYTYVSGFGESIALYDSLIGVSLDKYLGADFKAYEMLGVARYLTKKMYKEKIPSDCIRAWAVGEFPFTDESGNNLISKMIYEGKLIYFTKEMMPNEADSVVFGFTNNQLKWCKDNEKNMWATLIEQKFLFNTERFTIIKMTEEAPFTQAFTHESPGKACNWIGYQIIEKYMNSNKDITLQQLMEDNNHQLIFDKAKYKP